MTRIEEGYLDFKFGDKWRVLKFDEHPDYENVSGIVNGTKGVDFVGIFNEKTLYFIEVKDFRGDRIQNKDRISKGELLIEVAQKVRDSIACIIASSRTSNKENNLLPYAKFLCNHQKDIRVILWLEQDFPNNIFNEQRTIKSINSKTLKQKLKWLTSKVLVCSINSNKECLPDVKVSNLPRK